MSESDLISAYQAAEELWQGYVSIFVSVVFAYLVAAYLVGAKLTRWQAAIVTGLYALFGISFISILVIIFGRMTEIGSRILAISPDWTGFAATEAANSLSEIILYGPFIGAFIAGLLFMIQIRLRARHRVHKQAP